jgi:SAM-dependent methyltransferase
MGREINLLKHYPTCRRPIEQRARMVTEEHRRLARKFGKEYFDGDRLSGYGGYHYHPRFWRETARYFRDYYRLSGNASILDVGCAKGFLLHDFKELLPDARVAGLDISEYAIENASASIKPFLQVGNATALPFGDGEFDLVISINTIHNLDLTGCKTALREVQRVSRAHSFIVVDAWRTEAERLLLEQWILTCKTYLQVEDWKRLFAEVGYSGDYDWFFVS